MGWNKRFFFKAEAVILRLDSTTGMEQIRLQSRDKFKEAKRPSAAHFFEDQASNPNPNSSRQQLNLWMERIVLHCWMGADLISVMEWKQIDF